MNLPEDPDLHARSPELHAPSGDLHAQCPELLPWLVNGTLAAGVARPLRAHIEACVQCREDYESQLRLYEAMRAEDSLVFAEEPSLQKLMARIDGMEAAAGGLPAARRPAEDAGRSREPPGAERAQLRSRNDAARRAVRPRRLQLLAGTLAAAVVLEFIGLLLEPRLITRAIPAPADRAAAAYGTLFAPQPLYGASQRVRIVFRGQLSLEQLAHLLRSVDAHVVDGPTEANVYTLGFTGPLTAALLDQRLAVLRASTEVVFAEPVYAAGRTP